MLFYFSSSVVIVFFSCFVLASISVYFCIIGSNKDYFELEFEFEIEMVSLQSKVANKQVILTAALNSMQDVIFVYPSLPIEWLLSQWLVKMSRNKVPFHRSRILVLAISPSQCWFGVFMSVDGLIVSISITQCNGPVQLTPWRLCYSEDYGLIHPINWLGGVIYLHGNKKWA